MSNCHFEYDWHYGDINTALQQPMKQQALDGSRHCPGQSCGLDDGSPAAARLSITPSENLHIYLMGAQHFDQMKSIGKIKLMNS